jgi:[ribosomal protein S5]-alanine N-acetyltransferase
VESAAVVARSRAGVRVRGPAEGAGLSFAIADAESDAALGTIGLWLANLADGRATIGYSVPPAHRGRGVGGSALRALTTHAWTIPGLHRVELYIEPWNAGSIRVAESAAYRREGLLRSHQEIGGRRRDMLLYAAVRVRARRRSPTPEEEPGRRPSEGPD